MARAIEILWRSPPLSINPRSPITVSYPSGSDEDKVVSQGRAGSFFHPLPRGLGMAVRDVVEDGVIEQDRVLRDHGNLRAQGRNLQVAHIVPINQQTAAADIEEARQQMYQRCLAAAAGADDGDDFSRARCAG